MIEYIARRKMSVQNGSQVTEYQPGDVIAGFENWDAPVRVAHLRAEAVISRVITSNDGMVEPYVGQGAKPVVGTPDQVDVLPKEPVVPIRPPEPQDKNEAKAKRRGK